MDDDITRAANARKGSPFLTTDQAGRYIALSYGAPSRVGRGVRRGSFDATACHQPFIDKR